MVYSTRRFVVCLSVCHFVLVFLSPFSIVITSLGKRELILVLFVRLSICACLDLSVSSSCRVWEGLRFVIMALPGLFSYSYLQVTPMTKSEAFQRFGNQGDVTLRIMNTSCMFSNSL